MNEYNYWIYCVVFIWSYSKMKKLSFVLLLFISCIYLIGCGYKNNEDSIVPPLTNDILLDLAAEALPCDEWKAFANFAILWSWVSRQWNLMYYWVDEVMWFIPESGWTLKNTCYRIAPIAMEISQSDKWFKLVNSQDAEMLYADFLIEDYDPQRDWTELDDAVKKIFSQKAFTVWQERNYWEYFPDYEDTDRKTFEERAMEYFDL